MGERADPVDEIVASCRDLAGDDLLAVTVYRSDDIRHAYLADDLEAREDEIALDALRRPVQSVHRALELVGRLNPLGGDPQASTHLFEYVIYLRVPAGDQEGVIVSLARDSDLTGSILRECVARLDG